MEKAYKAILSAGPQWILGRGREKGLRETGTSVMIGAIWAAKRGQPMLSFYLSLISTESEREFVVWLYHKLKRRLLGYGYKLSSDVPWAQDATQQVFLAIIDRIEKFTQLQDDEIAAYGFTMMKNHYIRWKQRSRKVVELELFETDGVDGAPESPVEELVLERLAHAEAKAAVAKLKDKQQRVIALKYGLRWTHAEIARDMGISESYAQNLLAAA
ncbi:MAG: RNA polymerase sigma factor, partial [Christensenellaceae bacterium]|nr:RNA polymerase sigma factor [Christensenellaceae bacterium]